MPADQFGPVHSAGRLPNINGMAFRNIDLNGGLLPEEKPSAHNVGGDIYGIAWFNDGLMLVAPEGAFIFKKNNTAQPCGWTIIDYMRPITTTLPTNPADLDNDGDVDPEDMALFESKSSGPGVPHDGSPLAIKCDIDGDGDVDQSDFGLFQVELGWQG